MECYQDENYNSNYISVLISKPTFLFTIILETNLFLSMWSAYQKKCGKNLVFEKNADRTQISKVCLKLECAFELRDIKLKFENNRLLAASKK